MYAVTVWPVGGSTATLMFIPVTEEEIPYIQNI